MIHHIITKSALKLLPVLIFINTQSIAHFGSKGPFGGGVSCVAVNDSVVYFGTFTGGVFQSINSKLVAWSPRSVGLKSGKITALAHTGKYLFAGTADSGVFVFNGYAGSDRYWLKKNKGLSNLQITSLVALDSATVLVGTNGGGIFKTTDRGNTWFAVNNAILHHFEISAIIKAGDRVVHASIDGGVYATDDKGASWIDFNDEQTDDITVSALSYNSATNEILLANRDGLFITDSASSDNTPNYGLVESGLPSGITISSISNDGAHWYLVTDKGLFASSVNNINWIKSNTGMITDATLLVPFRNNFILGTAHNGVVKTLSFPYIWTNVATGFNNLKTYSITTGGNFLVVAATEKGVFISKDLAASYSASNKGLTDSLNVNDIAYGENRLLAATKNAGAFFSLDSGSTWTAVNNGIPNLEVKKVYISNGIKYAVLSNNLIFSAPLNSDQWTAIQNGLPTGVIISSLAFYGNKLILGTDKGIYTKQFSVTIWSVANTNLSNLNVTSVTSWGTKIYAGTMGSGVFMSDTGSVNWTPTSKTSIAHTVTMGLNGDYIQDMASYAGYVYASYKGGLLATSDNGATWIAGGNQFNLPSYTDVNKISFVTTRVFVTTQNNSLYSNSLSELPVIAGLNEEIWAKAKGSLSVVPNPNNGNFYVSSVSPILQLSIYDASGVLVKEGNGESVFNLVFPKGIYFVKAKTENGLISQKFIVE